MATRARSLTSFNCSKVGVSLSLSLFHFMKNELHF